MLLRMTRLFATAAFLSMSLAGCTVTWLSRYDIKTDEIVSSMQKSFTAHSMKILAGGKPACLHSANDDYYRAARVDVSALELRTTAIPLNGPTIQQVGALKGAIDSFERLDELAERRGACLSGAELSPIDRGINQIFGAILKLELAKLRGDKRPSE